MPFRSEKQRRFMWKTHPRIAKKWARGGQTRKKGDPDEDSDEEEEPKQYPTNLHDLLRARERGQFPRTPQQHRSWNRQTAAYQRAEKKIDQQLAQEQARLFDEAEASARNMSYEEFKNLERWVRNAAANRPNNNNNNYEHFLPPLNETALARHMTDAGNERLGEIIAQREKIGENTDALPLIYSRITGIPVQHTLNTIQTTETYNNALREAEKARQVLAELEQSRKDAKRQLLELQQTVSRNNNNNNNNDNKKRKFDWEDEKRGGQGHPHPNMPENARRFNYNMGDLLARAQQVAVRNAFPFDEAPRITNVGKMAQFMAGVAGVSALPVAAKYIYDKARNMTRGGQGHNFMHFLRNRERGLPQEPIDLRWVDLQNAQMVQNAQNNWNQHRLWGDPLRPDNFLVPSILQRYPDRNIQFAPDNLPYIRYREEQDKKEQEKRQEKNNTTNNNNNNNDEKKGGRYFY
jgi:hypothetical protein